MKLPKLEPLKLTTANPGQVAEYHFQIKLAQLTGTNGPRDLFSAYTVDFFEKYAAAFATTIDQEIVIGYDGSRYHQSISISAREYLRRMGISVKELDGPVTVPEFMFICHQLGLPGCFFGRSHSPQQYVGLKCVINGEIALDLLRKNGAEIDRPKNVPLKTLFGFLPRTLAPIIEAAITENKMIHPQKMGAREKIATKDMREAFFASLKKVTPLEKIDGNYIIDCRHSMAGEVWELVKSESKAEITLHNNKLDPTAPDRDPREIWDTLIEKYAPMAQAVFDHDADADRTFLVKTPGKGRERILMNQEKAFATGLLAEAEMRKADAYVLVQERINLILLSSLATLTETVYATAQGEPPFFLGVLELLTKKQEIERISGADYTDIFFGREHPICMKSPYQQALWMMYWFTKNRDLPPFPETNLLKTQITMLTLNYPQRLEKVLQSSEALLEYFKKNFEIRYYSKIDGQNLIVTDKKGNTIVTSIRPSGTGRYSKVITEVGLGEATEKERFAILKKVNASIAKIIG